MKEKVEGIAVSGKIYKSHFQPYDFHSFFRTLNPFFSHFKKKTIEKLAVDNAREVYANSEFRKRANVSQEVSC